MPVAEERRAKRNVLRAYVALVLASVDIAFTLRPLLPSATIFLVEYNSVSSGRDKITVLRTFWFSNFLTLTFDACFLQEGLCLGRSPFRDHGTCYLTKTRIILLLFSGNNGETKKSWILL